MASVISEIPSNYIAAEVSICWCGDLQAAGIQRVVNPSPHRLIDVYDCFRLDEYARRIRDLKAMHLQPTSALLGRTTARALRLEKLRQMDISDWDRVGEVVGEKIRRNSFDVSLPFGLLEKLIRIGGKAVCGVLEHSDGEVLLDNFEPVDAVVPGASVETHPDIEVSIEGMSVSFHTPHPREVTTTIGEQVCKLIDDHLLQDEVFQMRVSHYQGIVSGDEFLRFDATIGV